MKGVRISVVHKRDDIVRKIRKTNQVLYVQKVGSDSSARLVGKLYDTDQFRLMATSGKILGKSPAMVKESDCHHVELSQMALVKMLDLAGVKLPTSPQHN